MVNYKILAEQRAKNKNQVEDGLTFDNFLAACYVKCTPQSYGPKIEKRIIQDFKFDKIPSRKGEGDLLVTTSTDFPNYNFKENETIELKSSYLSSDGSWNFIQLRPYEKFDYYLFLLIDPLNGCNYEYILLNKEDVNDSNFKLNSIHGTKESNKENKNIEYKLNVPQGSETYEKLISFSLI